MGSINKTSKLMRGLAAVGGAFALTLAISPVASAQAANSTPASQTYQVNLSAVNNSGVTGTATLTLTGNSLRVNMRATGASANLAHATHIHVGGAASCPTPSADTDKDKYVSAKEAEASTGPMKVSLTTSGDTGTGSALAVDRMPKADAKGNITYDRTFTLPSGVTAADMSKATIDVHGISSLFDDKAKYDGSKKSELDNKIAFETTVPAACGKLTSTPTSGAATGAGSTSGIESPALFAIGGAALLAAVATAIVARKQFSATE